jgi:hypothetical protein
MITYNPSTYSWVHWLNSDVALVYKVASGILLLIGWIMYLRATWMSLGVIGTVLAAAFWRNDLATHRMGRACAKQYFSSSLGRRIRSYRCFSRWYVMVTHSPQSVGTI